jgi:hypothetical protein
MTFEIYTQRVSIMYISHIAQIASKFKDLASTAGKFTERFFFFIITVNTTTEYL